MHSTSSSFGPEVDPGDDDEVSESIRRDSKPEHEIPATMATTIVLGRTDELAVAINGLHVYRNGLEFSLTAWCRGRLAQRGTLYEGLSGGSHHSRRGPGIEPFLFGVEFSDGRSATNLGQHWPLEPPDLQDAPRLNELGGHSNGRSAEQTYFLSPLPPGDTLTFVAAWPSLGITETKTVVDATAIRAAAEQVTQLWPWEPQPTHEPEPEPLPVIPPGSWFNRG